MRAHAQTLRGNRRWRRLKRELLRLRRVEAREVSWEWRGGKSQLALVDEYRAAINLAEKNNR